MRAAILSIGDELALGQVVDTNAPWLAARLAECGVFSPLHIVVADDQAAIVRLLRLAAESAELVIATGGLGPTDDDLTRPALAEFLGAELVEDPESVVHIEQFFQARGRQMPQRNRLQALHPRGTQVLHNPVGTAPGIAMRLGTTHLFCVPGVPSEMRDLYTRHIEPFLQSVVKPQAVVLTRTVHTYGAGESTIADLLGDLMDRRRNPLVGTTASEAVISVRIRSESSSRTEAARRLDDTEEQVRSRLGTLIFGAGDQTLQEAVGRLLIDARATLATAESCTGGLLGKRITDVAGSSRYYIGGFVTYSNEAKVRDLGIAPALIEQHGAVSEPVARAMAEGAMQRCGADCALSITGIAGPEGGTPDKPVGTVWIALARRNGQTQARLHRIPESRAVVRDRATKAALNMLRLEMIKSGP
jgi:nicotinamide-nucleotide amidase